MSVDLASLRVSEMDDGGMGSLQFGDRGERQLSEYVANCSFKDVDGTLVVAGLNIDLDGALFELDIWKTDSSPLIRWPEQRELHSHELSPVRRSDR